MSPSCRSESDSDGALPGSVDGTGGRRTPPRVRSISEADTDSHPQDSPTDLRFGSRRRGAADSELGATGAVYLVHVLRLDWRHLPGRESGAHAERVWLLGAADREGRHRSRLLVVGREWRPRCLERVNMLSQPVVYAGGGSGALTAELFLWWFRREFAATALSMHPEGATLVVEHADYLPAEQDRVLAGGLLKILVVPKRYVHSRLVVDELRLRLATSVLFEAVCNLRADALCAANGEDTDSPADAPAARIDEFVERFSLKEAFAELHRAWLAVDPATFDLCWRVRGEEGPDAFEEQEKKLTSELRRVAREAGLRMTDADVRRWLLDDARESSPLAGIKTENGDCSEEVTDCKAGPTEHAAPQAWEVARLLTRVLDWMEGEPLEPNYLLAVRAMRSTATLMVSRVYRSREPEAYPTPWPSGTPGGDGGETVAAPSSRPFARAVISSVETSANRLELDERLSNISLKLAKRRVAYRAACSR